MPQEYDTIYGQLIDTDNNTVNDIIGILLIKYNK